MCNSLSKEDWFNVLATLFDIYVGHDNVDEDAWLEDFNNGKSPHDAFFDEHPEYDDLGV